MSEDQAFRRARGGRIVRDEPISFTFDGARHHGYRGDSLASALLANGIRLVGRSFKYHRPRGIMGTGAEEPNALVRLDDGHGRTDPNMRATQVELFDGLDAVSQNRWPSLRRDVGAINDVMAPLIPAGFYYKTFMQPATFWKSVYEPNIRRAAGLGRAPERRDPDRYLHRHAHCDVLIVGGGPAGLAAALTAAEMGTRVILADEQSEPGGWILSLPEEESRFQGLRSWHERALERLAAMPEVTLLRRATVTSYFDHQYLLIDERVTDHLASPPPELPRRRLWRVRAKQVILATGAIERPLVLDNNDLPGVMLTSAALTYANRWATLVGRRAVVFTTNDSAYHAARDLQAAGIEIAAIVDPRDEPGPAARDAAESADLPLEPRALLSGIEGRRAVERARVMPFDERRNGMPQVSRAYECDCVLLSGGWNPNLSLFAQSRGRIRYDEAALAFLPHEPFQGTLCAGAAAGETSLKGAMKSGTAAAGQALRALGLTNREADLPEIDEDERTSPALPLWRVPRQQRDSRARAFVDFQNDVTAKDLDLALSEGFTSIEHVKRYTTTGMGTDQGRTSNVNALGIVADKLGLGIGDLGVTTFRPPYTPLTFGALVGASRGPLFDVVRTTAMHEWAEADGAVFEDVGNWKRARYFPKDGEDMHAAVQRECRAVRSACGLLDASTLGKIDLQGKDCREFLNRIYTNAWSRLEPGRCRYGLMLRDDGMVFDDGVTACLADDHFHMTTTTGGAARVLAWLEEWLQTEWPDLEVYCTSVTEQWATMALSGPQARDVLASLVEGVDLGAAAFPHMSFKEARIAGVEGRIFRISFTGEASYEINVPSSYGRAVWEAVIDSGKRHALCVYGTEAMHVLRAEKGYIIVGQETDGTATPYDLGMDWIVSKKKPDFIGKRSLQRPDMQRADRKQLVGLQTKDPNTVLSEGGQIVLDPQQSVPMRMIGHVTSSYMSPACGRSIALAMLEGGRAREGSTIHVPMLDGKAIAAQVVAPVFFDPKGERLHG